jgi:3-deoxy-D-manno-octulosonic-acid transferase
MAAAAASPKLLRKSRTGWSDRLGITMPAVTTATKRKRVLLHAVSVGEVNALRTLVPLLAAKADVFVCTTTDTGLSRANELYSVDAVVCRMPMDFSWGVNRILSKVQPDVVGLVELELWPNMISACRRRDIPVAVINGRLSARSFDGYSKARPIIGGLFQSLAVAAVQDESYAKRFRAMGARRVEVTGSMKWDAANLSRDSAKADELAEQLGIDRTKKLIVAGSTGPGEEELLHEACPSGIQLLCAPRKPERFDGAALSLGECVRRSTGEKRDGATRFLLDTIGELRLAYELADLVVMGRSFGEQFGSDPTEPAALGRATLIGPSVGDFTAIVSELEDAGGLARTTRRSLGADLERLIRDDLARQKLADAAQHCVLENRGSSARHAEMLLALADMTKRRRGPWVVHG